MTIRLLCAYDRYPANAIVTLDAGTEAGLIATKQALADTTGGTPFVPVSGPVQTRVGTFSVRGGRAETLLLPEGQALIVTGAAASTGTVQRLDTAGAPLGAAVAVGAGALPQIGPFAGSQKIMLTCSAGSIDATVQDAVLTSPQTGDPRLVTAVNQALAPNSAKITTHNGRLFMNGQPFRNVGVNAHDLLIDYLAGGTAYVTDLPAIASYGCKIIRVSAAPIDSTLWASQVGTDGTAPVAGYLTKVRTFLDAAAAAGMGCELVLFWSFALTPPAVGGVQADYLTAGSTTRTYMKNFATTMALNFYDHPGLAMWAVGNEWFDSASLAKFATSTSDTTKDHLGALAATCGDIVDGIRTWDADRAVASGSGTNGYFQAGQVRQFVQKLIRAAGKCDIVSFHAYPDTDGAAGGYDHAFAGLDNGGYRILLPMLRQACIAAGKVLMMEECCGEYDSTSMGGAYIGQLADRSYMRGINAGVEIVMDWGWYAASPQYIGDLKTQRRVVMTKIAALNATLSQAFVPPPAPYPAMGSFKAPALCARGKGTANSFIRIPNDPSLSVAPGTTGRMWRMFWIRKSAVLAATARIYANNDGTQGALLTPDSGGNEGLAPQETFTSGVINFTPVGLTYPANNPVNQTRFYPNDWLHFVDFFDGTQTDGGVNGWSDNAQHRTIWVNGLPQARMKKGTQQKETLTFTGTATGTSITVDGLVVTIAINDTAAQVAAKVAAVMVANQTVYQFAKATSGAIAVQYKVPAPRTAIASGSGASMSWSSVIGTAGVAVGTVAGLSTRDLYLMAASDGSSNYANIDICDVICGKDSDLTSDMVADYLLLGRVPPGAQHRWTLDGNTLDSIGTLHASIGAVSSVPQVTFVPSGLGSL